MDVTFADIPRVTITSFHSDPLLALKEVSTALNSSTNGEVALLSEEIVSSFDVQSEKQCNNWIHKFFTPTFAPSESFSHTIPVPEIKERCEQINSIEITRT